MNEKTLLVLDGHSLAFRAFYALDPESFRTAQGQYTNAVHGFLSTLLKLLSDYSPTHVAVAFDLPGGTFRTREYADYKGGRRATPEEFKGQIGVIQEVLDAIGIKWLTYPDFEADDIVATLSTKGASAGMRVYIASGDKDAYQLVDDSVTLLYPMPRSQMMVLDPAGVEKKSGVSPALYPDLAALVGEGADNIPGVDLWGPKTAAKWLNHYGGLQVLLEHVNEIGGKRGENLAANVEMVLRNRKINQLVRTLDIGDDMSEFEPKGFDRTRVHELFDTLDFTRLRQRVLSQMQPRVGSEEPLEGEETSEVPQIQVVAEKFADFRVNHPGPWALAIAGEGGLRQGRVDAFAIAASDMAVYASDFTALDSAEAQAVTAFLEDGTAKKLGHGTKAIWHAFKNQGIDLAGISADTELEAYLLHPDQKGYPLTDLAGRYLPFDVGDLGEDSGKNQQMLAIPVPGEESNLPIARRAAVLHPLRNAFEQELKVSDPQGRLIELELQVSRILTQMEHVGIAVNLDRLESLRKEFDGRVVQAEQLAHSAIGDDSVNLSSPKQLQTVLFETLDLPKTRKTKSGYTTNADALADLLEKIAFREDDAAVAGQNFLAALLEYRDAIKLRQSVEGLQKSAIHGRIHTTYQQTVAATGRLSSTEPNLQNIHARTAEGLQIREVFVPGEGYDYLMTADYSQIEMRLMAHLSGDEALIEAFNQGADLHSFVASRVFGVPEAEVTSQQRSRIKAMSYGLAYGLSAFGLSKQLRIPVGQAERLMDDYFSRFGKVHEYLVSVVEQARKDSFTSTIWGRRRYLPELTSTNRQLREAAERMALNAPIQGSAADIIKRAMVLVDAKLAEAKLKSQVLLQVHDELILEVVAEEAEEVEQILREQMGGAAQLSVPLSVGVGIGRNWREAAH